MGRDDRLGGTIKKVRTDVNVVPMFLMPRYRVGDSPDATALQEEVRIESGQIFPTSARDSMSHGPAARARVVRGVRQAPGKSQELGR